jgi:hypothetical protein
MSGDPPRSPLRPFPSLQITGDVTVAQDNTHVCLFHLYYQILSCKLKFKSFCSVCIRDAKEAFSVRPRFEDKFTYLTLDVEDSEEQNLIRLFPTWVQACFSLEFYLDLSPQSENVY